MLTDHHPGFCIPRLTEKRQLGEDKSRTHPCGQSSAGPTETEGCKYKGGKGPALSRKLLKHVFRSGVGQKRERKKENIEKTRFRYRAFLLSRNLAKKVQLPTVPNDLSPFNFSLFHLTSAPRAVYLALEQNLILL